MPLTVISPMSSPGEPGGPHRRRALVVPASEQADERIPPARWLIDVRRIDHRQRLLGRRAAAWRRFAGAAGLGVCCGAGAAPAPTAERGSMPAASGSRWNVIARSLSHRRLLRHDSRALLAVPAAASCSTNVVATHSAVIVAFGSGGVFARIAMSLTLMIRGNLLM